MLPADAPEWEPLLDLAEEHLEDFMWMYTAALSNGRRIQAYKHYWTRRYLFLDGDGRAYAYLGEHRYEETGARWALARVVEEELANKDWYDSVRQNDWADPEEIEVSWTRSATKHRIARARSGYVVRHCGLRFVHSSHDGPLPWGDNRFLFLGDDEQQTALEVVALDVGEEAFRVIHATEVRRKHLGLYWRAKRWQR